MSVVYVPVYRTAASYQVSFGRRWSILEQMLLIELASGRRTVSDLATSAALPDRLIVEALINLLRNNWIEVVATEAGVFFAATAVGKRQSAQEKELPTQLENRQKWMSLCYDRVTGAWLRADDLTLAYERDLPADAPKMDPIYMSYDPRDGGLRDLLYLGPEESLEPDEPRLKTPSRPFARIDVSLGVPDGLPAYAPAKLREAVLDFAADLVPAGRTSVTQAPKVVEGTIRDTIRIEDIVVGGDEHIAAVRSSLAEAATSVVIHSCFTHPGTIERLLPDLELAAKRKVRVDLLWGLRSDAEAEGPPVSIKDANRVLDKLPDALRAKVQLSPVSSGSHAKLIVFDRAGEKWTSIVGSCNFLSSWYNALDVSIRSTNPRLGAQLLGWMIGAQQPAAGGWSATARRLNALWGRARVAGATHANEGDHTLELLVDADHYACVRTARDRAETDILLGCDLFGLAAETSVLVPLARAAELGKRVSLFYQRPSKLLMAEGRLPDAEALARRGLGLSRVESLHGKFLMWDHHDLIVTSFNWLSTVAEGTRSRGAEIGIHVSGPGLRAMFAGKTMAHGASASLQSALRSADITAQRQSG